MKAPTAALDDAVAMRRADRELLSLALMQARNRTLAWLAALEALPDAARLAGSIGWRQERRIARNVERARGMAADLRRAPLPSVDAAADVVWGDVSESPPPPSPDRVRGYLAETLETTLELLARTDSSDDELHWFRDALHHEDGAVIGFAMLAQQHDVDVRRLLPERPLRTPRPPVWLPAQRHWLGSPRGGHVPAAERWAHEEAVPEFEIDAQPVSWRQFAEFVEDGGYDDPIHWSAEGARWLRDGGRRTPRDVEQVRHGVVLRRFGRLLQAPAAEPASMLTWYEADAWCRWAGRRLPTEVEWELAAERAASRGFVWGDVREWTAGAARAWPGGPALGPVPLRVQRGVAGFEPRRLAHPKARWFVAAADDAGFAGFRSCAP